MKDKQEGDYWYDGYYWHCDDKHPTWEVLKVKNGRVYWFQAQECDDYIPLEELDGSLIRIEPPGK